MFHRSKLIFMSHTRRKPRRPPWRPILHGGSYQSNHLISPKKKKGDSPSASALVNASAYTLTTSSVPLGLTNDLPFVYLCTRSVSFACRPSGLSSSRSALPGRVTNAPRLGTLTLTRRFGRSG